MNTPAVRRKREALGIPPFLALVRGGKGAPGHRHGPGSRRVVGPNGQCRRVAAAAFGYSGVSIALPRGCPDPGARDGAWLTRRPVTEETT